jgi:hypothetical protein
MNWKTRQLFSDREHGIVSGLSPVNMMGGGSVPMPGYKIGGTVPPAPKDIPFEEGRTLFEYERDMYHPIAQRQMEEYALEEEEYATIEQRVAELAAQQGISVPEARGMILDQVLQEKGLTLPIKIINQFATGLITLHEALTQAVGPPKMQTGGLALDLFEEGDEEINEPLNIMAQATNPSIADITPAETVEETVPLTEDQGPTDVSALKEAFQQLAIQAVDAAKDAIAQGAPVEQVQGPLQERLMMIDEQYRQKSGTQDTILTEEFLTQLGSLTDISAEVVSMQVGGSVPDLPPINDLDRARYELSEAEVALAAHKAKRKPPGMMGRQYDTVGKQLEAAIQDLKEKINLLRGDAENVTGIPTDGPAADVAAKAKADAAAKAKIEAIAIAKAKADAEAKAKANKEEKKDIIPALTTQGFWEEMKANANRARRGTMMSGKSKQGGILGTMDVLGQAEIAGAKSLGDAQEAMLSQLGASERTAATLGKPTSLTKEERDFAKGNPLFAQQLFLKRVGADVDIDEVIEEFIREGIPLPAFGGTLIGGLGGIITTKAGTKINFSQFYQDAKAGDPSLKFEAIKAGWEKAKVDPENTYTA